jgi:hypothetical protein
MVSVLQESLADFYLASSLSGLGESPQGFSSLKQGSEPVYQR